MGCSLSVCLSVWLSALYTRGGHGGTDSREAWDVRESLAGHAAVEAPADGGVDGEEITAGKTVFVGGGTRAGQTRG